jgi:hypothetical protein
LWEAGFSVASRVLTAKIHLSLAIFLHLFQLILDDDGLINQMLKIWVFDIEQLKLDLIFENLEKHVLLLLIGVDIISGIPRQLDELVQILIHHHISLVQLWEFLLLQLEGATGHVVNPEVSLEVIAGDSFDIGVSVVVSLPPVSCGPKLVCREWNLFMVEALGYL